MSLQSTSGLLPSNELYKCTVQHMAVLVSESVTLVRRRRGGVWGVEELGNIMKRLQREHSHTNMHSTTTGMPHACHCALINANCVSVSEYEHV